MNVFFPTLVRHQKQPNWFYPLGWSQTPQTKKICDEATQLTRKIFGGSREIYLGVNDTTIYRYSHLNLSLHPLFLFDISDFDEQILSPNTSEFDAQLWLSDQYKEGIEDSSRPFSVALKIVRFLSEKNPKTYEGVRRFMLARDIATLQVSSGSHTAGFYSDIGYSSWGTPALISKTFKLIPFVSPILGLITSGSALVGAAIAVGILATKIFMNYRSGKVEKAALIRAVKATGDLKSAKNYYGLIRHFNPRRFDWLRRNTIDRLMLVHDPVKTLGSLRAK